jgi:hypothetical protein
MHCKKNLKILNKITLKEEEQSSNEVEEQQLQISFLQTESESNKVDANKMFENELALDDKYDPNLRTPKNRGMDLNNISKTTERDLDRKLRSDLESEHVNYRFD